MGGFLLGRVAVLEEEPAGFHAVLGGEPEHCLLVFGVRRWNLHAGAMAVQTTLLIVSRSNRFDIAVFKKPIHLTLLVRSRP